MDKLSSIKDEWSSISTHLNNKHKLKLDFQQKMLDLFQIGNCYYLVFSPADSKIVFMSDTIQKVNGYTKEEFDTETFLSGIHKKDLSTFLAFEKQVVDFKSQLPTDKIMKYKSRYNFRFRKKDGDYIHVLQQSVTIAIDEEGKIIYNLIIHTDVSHLKETNKMQLSFIGLGGEPSYLNVQPNNIFIESPKIFTKREKEILVLLSQNKSSQQIAEQLFISLETVKTHRKHLLQKTNTSNILGLIMVAMENGWV